MALVMVSYNSTFQPWWGFYLCIMCVPVQVYVHHTSAGAHQGQEMAKDHLELELQPSGLLRKHKYLWAISPLPTQDSFCSQVVVTALPEELLLTGAS